MSTKQKLFRIVIYILVNAFAVFAGFNVPDHALITNPWFNTVMYLVVFNLIFLIEWRWKPLDRIRERYEARLKKLESGEVVSNEKFELPEGTEVDSSSNYSS